MLKPIFNDSKMNLQLSKNSIVVCKINYIHYFLLDYEKNSALKHINKKKKKINKLINNTSIKFDCQHQSG